MQTYVKISYDDPDPVMVKDMVRGDIGVILNESYKDLIVLKTDNVAVVLNNRDIDDPDVKFLGDTWGEHATVKVRLLEPGEEISITYVKTLDLA